MDDHDHADPYLLRPIGIVRSNLKRLEDCPRQGREGAPDALVEISSYFDELRLSPRYGPNRKQAANECWCCIIPAIFIKYAM